LWEVDLDEPTHQNRPLYAKDVTWGVKKIAQKNKTGVTSSDVTVDQ